MGFGATPQEMGQGTASLVGFGATPQDMCTPICTQGQSCQKKAKEILTTLSGTKKVFFMGLLGLCLFRRIKVKGKPLFERLVEIRISWACVRNANWVFWVEPTFLKKNI